MTFLTPRILSEYKLSETLNNDAHSMKLQSFLVSHSPRFMSPARAVTVSEPPASVSHGKTQSSTLGLTLDSLYKAYDHKHRNLQFLRM